jgi:hypothetical protein
MAYGVGVFHDPQRPRVADALRVSQNKGLRKVMGAYKATPIRNLELESFCAPLDIYFNKRLADFEQRLQNSPLGILITTACRSIKYRLKNRRGRPKMQKMQFFGTDTGQWAERWLEGVEKRSSSKALLRDWKDRWAAGVGVSGAQRAADVVLPKAYKGGHLRIYEGLTKAQSSILCQARTGKIGLRAFLFSRRVPDVDTPICP